jgi:TPR repeat protein
MTCCGKGMHPACFEKKMKSKSMSMEQKNSCCLCRRKLPTSIGSKEDLERIHHFIKKGKGWSMAMLAERYKDGAGVDQSWEQAAYYYKMAVEHGNVISMVHLGILYVTGQGVEQDNEKGKELWMKAVALGDITAIMNLKSWTPSFTPTPTFCSYCGKAHNPPTSKLNACTGCRSAFYCCKEHQRKDWRMKDNGHKKECGELKELNKQYQQNK